MGLLRGVDKEAHDLAFGINIASIGELHITWQIEQLVDAVLHLIGMKFIWRRPNHPNDEPAVARDSVMHGAGHGQGLVASVLIHISVHRAAAGNRKITILMMVAAHYLAG